MLRVAAGNVPAWRRVEGRAGQRTCRFATAGSSAPSCGSSAISSTGPSRFAELRRVLGRGGRLVVITFDPAHFGSSGSTGTSRRSRQSIARVSRTPTSWAPSSTGAGFADGPVPRVIRSGRRSRGNRRSSASSSATSRPSTSSSDEGSRGHHHGDERTAPTVEYPIEWLVAVAVALTAVAVMAGPVRRRRRWGDSAEQVT